MIIKLEQDLTREEIEVFIRYAQMNNTIEQLVSHVESFRNTVKCSQEDREVLVNVSDIFYIESVDKRSFVYCADKVYRTEPRLYQFMEELSGWGFVQVSKSCIVNINKLESIRPLLNSRMEATLLNGERVNVTRRYVSGIRKKLQGM